MTVNFSGSGVKHRMPVDARSLGYTAASTVIGRLERLLVQIVALEFLVIAGTCYLASAIYYETFLSTWPPVEQYVPAALSIALLVLLTALGFKHYVGVQMQSRDRFMWSGIGAVALAFSLFLSLLFVFKIADWYSRGTFFFQAHREVVWVIFGLFRSTVCCCCRCVHVGNALALSIMSTAMQRSSVANW